MTLKISEIVKKSLTPLFYGLCAVMAVSGLWIMLYGPWLPLWPPVLSVFIAPLVFPFLLFPAAFFSGLMRIFEQSRPVVSKLLMAATMGWFVFIISAFHAFVARLVYFLLPGDTFWPACLWMVSATIAPWAHFAARDRDNLFFTGLVWMALLGAISSVVFMVTVAADVTDGVLVMAAIMSVCLGLQALYEKFVLLKKV